jgi:hypothetical protein
LARANSREGFLLYREKHQDLFKVSTDYALAHCISADCAMGAGIAKQFVQRFPDMKPALLSRTREIGTAVLHRENKRNIFNLITKKFYYHKPKYINLEKSLIDMKKQCLRENIPKIAMPMIGSGLDRLDWKKVSFIIQSTFRNSSIEILVCKI